MPVQFTFDDLARGTEHRASCRWLVRNMASGTVKDGGIVYLGECGLMRISAYDRRCDDCDSWEARP